MKNIELKPLCEIGNGSAKITDESVEIEVFGISGGMKAWLVGGEDAEHIGNIVSGKLHKRIDTTRHNGILITQSGRQILMGAYAETIVPSVEMEESAPFEEKGVKWKKHTGKNYSGLCNELRYILSNKSVYKSYKRYGHFWVGENEEYGALALKIENPGENPFARFGELCVYENGYVMVGVDKKTKEIKKLL